jgi:hypothetical protein
MKRRIIVALAALLAASPLFAGGVVDAISESLKKGAAESSASGGTASGAAGSASGESAEAHATVPGRLSEPVGPVESIGAYTVDTEDALGPFLQRLELNTPETPYTIKVKSLDMDDGGLWNESDLFYNNITIGRRYVILDLSNHPIKTISYEPLDGPPNSDYTVGLILPKGLKTLGVQYYASFNGRVFAGFRVLTAIDIPESLTAIPDECFVDCAKLIEINAPSVTKWGRSSISDTPFDANNGRGTVGARINLAHNIQDLTGLPTMLSNAYKKSGGGWYVRNEQGWVKAASKAAAVEVAAAAMPVVEPVETTTPAAKKATASTTRSDGSYAAKIGSTTYSTLEAAITDAGSRDVIEIYKVTGPELSAALNTSAGLGKKYRLMQNITQAVTTPIGAGTVPFTGAFDGNGHNIALGISGEVSSTYTGLFGALSVATVKSLSLSGTVNVTCGANSTFNWVGALVGGCLEYRCDCGAFERCGDCNGQQQRIVCGRPGRPNI